jgi:hypothetical protein
MYRRPAGVNNKGQALLFVIAAMTIALALGINVSVRVLQSISRTSRSDTSERVFAAAEGGIEKALSLPASVLTGGIANSSDCSKIGGYVISGVCVVKFQSAGDPIIAQAGVVVSDFNWTDPSTQTYKFKLEQDTVTEVNVQGIPSDEEVKICWTPITKADIYYIVYGDSGTLTKKGWNSPGGSPPPPYDPNNFENADPGGSGKNWCTKDVTVPSGSLGLRIKSIGGDSTVEVTNPSLPNQGFKIVSTGEITSEGTVKTQKVITVYKSLPFLPNLFDFGIMSVQGDLLK